MLLLLACAAPPKDDLPVVSDAVLTPSEAIPTVATLTYTTDRPARTFVRYGAARVLDTARPAEATTTHTATLVGVPADTDATWEIVDADGAVLADDTWTTGPLDPALPTLTATGAGNDQWVFTALVGEVEAAVLISPEGEIVWWHLTDGEGETLRALPSRDGTGVYYNAAVIAGGTTSDDTALVHVSWDGTTVTPVPVPRLAHDFVELPDGTLGALQTRIQAESTPEEVRGNAIVEISTDGVVTDVWTSWDCFDPATTPGDTPALGWTFTNALDHDPATGRYLVGARNLSAIAWVDAATGACEAILGGDTSDYTFTGARFLHQHQFHAFEADDGPHVLVFDNEGAGAANSRVLEYRLDGDMATEVWNYSPSPSVYAFVLGDAQRLADGDTFVTWSVAGLMERVAPDGSVPWRLQAESGAAFGFTTLADRPVP